MNGSRGMSGVFKLTNHKHGPVCGCQQPPAAEEQAGVWDETASFFPFVLDKVKSQASSGSGGVLKKISQLKLLVQYHNKKQQL